MHLKFLYAGLVGALIVSSVLAWDWYNVVPPEEVANAHYVGRQTCASCHAKEHKEWLGSDHDRAMEIATEATVLGDFNNAKFTYQGVTSRFFRDGSKFMVNTEGPDGEFRDFEIKYTFGVDPLQQYMIEFPDGRVQVLRESWDVINKRWFYVTPPDVTDERIEPGDPLHWTGIAQNWNTTCADCHSTDVHKNYDPKTNTYRTTFEEINVGCEECHGPGSVHANLAKGWFWDRNIGYGLPPLKDKNLNVQLEMCAKCHSRRYQVHEQFRPGEPLLDYYEPALISAGLYEANGQILDEVYEYGSFLQSKMHANHVRCSDCHNPHSLKLKFTGNALCTQCHVPGKYDTPSHHHHPGNSTGAQCIECHMPERTYMVIDGRRDHSFRVPRPDLSVLLGTPNACNDCHTKPGEDFQWAADTVRKWYGEKRPDDPHWAPAIAAGRLTKPEGEPMLLDVLKNRATPPIIRATVLDLLANYPSAPSEAARRQALNDPDDMVRLSAVRTVPFTDDPESVLALAEALDDPRRTIRLAAAARLAPIPIQYIPSEHRRAFEQSLIEFRKSQELSLDHAGSHLTLGALDRRQGRVPDAIEHYRTAIQLEPYLAGPRAELASLLQETGGKPAEIRRLRNEEADLMERDSQLAPDSPQVFYQLGLLRYLLDEFEKAEEAMLRSHQLAPQNYEFLMALALLQQHRYKVSGEMSHFNAAVESLKKLNALRPEDPRAEQILKELINLRRSMQPGKESSGASAKGPG